MRELLTAISPVVVGFFTLLGVRITAKAGADSTRKGQESSDLQWRFDQLQEEVTRQGSQIELQDRKIDALNAKLDSVTRLARKAVNFIDRIGIAHQAGRPLPTPDGELVEHVDMSLWSTTEN